jgi:alpha-beta hydrolase superfamily lysophospholipase
VPTSWGNIRVQIFGTKSPSAKPIVAFHGYLDNSNSFMPLAHYLTKSGYFIVAIDAPGHGFRFLLHRIV